MSKRCVNVVYFPTTRLSLRERIDSLVNWCRVPICSCSCVNQLHWSQTIS